MVETGPGPADRASVAAGAGAVADTHYDVAVCGGGPVGSAAALALTRAGRRTVLLEGRADGSIDDDRTIALAHGSRVALERLGVDWSALEATPIETVHVSDRGHFGRVLLQAADCGAPALGYVASYRSLCHGLDRAVDRAALDRLRGVRVIGIGTTPSYAAVSYGADGRGLLTASLAAVADGGRGSSLVPGTRDVRHDYRQCAIVAVLGTDPPQHGVAWERFTAEGPIALLPWRRGYSMVWTMDEARAEQVAALEPAAFLARLQDEFGSLAGRLVEVGARSLFPLALRLSHPAPRRRVVLIGNAAQTLHPVAGQGFNIGLRDALGLADAVLASGGRDAGSDDVLAKFRAARRRDRMEGVGITHGLVNVFGSTRGPVAFARSLGLAALELAPGARAHFARRMMFGAG